MQEFRTMLSTQCLLLLYMALGFLVSRLGLLSAEGRRTLTNLAMDVFLPCSIFNSFSTAIGADQVRSALTILALAAAVVLLTLGLGWLLYRRYPQEKQCVLRYSLVVSNAALAGMPIMEMTYGAVGLFYAAVYVIPARIFTWSAGREMFRARTDLRTKLRNMLLHPCMVAVYLGAARMLLSFSLPALAAKAVSGLAACATPVSMLVIGCVLSTVDLRDLFDRDVAVLCALRLLVIPGLILLLTLPLPLDPVARATAVTLGGMPIASTAPMFADAYGGDARLASKGAFWSTLLSLVTVPLLTLLLQL